MEKQLRLRQAWQYFGLGLLLWLVVDFGTAGGFRISYFQRYGAALLFFYLGFPLLFTVLIFKLHWSERRLFLATLAAIFVVEVLCTRNPWLVTFPALLLGIPLAVLVYAPLTYFPLWFVRRQLAEHRVLVILLAAVELFIMLLTTFGQPRS